MGNRYLTCYQRFWGSINKNGPIHSTLGTCWQWTGYKTSRGYGSLTINWKAMRAHRFSWILHFGHIPEGLCVLHKCDNPSCVNPRHLEIGTNAQNSQDMVAKDRQAKGEDNGGGGKLVENEIKEIRALYVKGSREFGTSALGRKYCVSHTLIRMIVTRKIWRHL